jgi:uncharacterized phage infection (PIP) family protein YhgE
MEEISMNGKFNFAPAPIKEEQVAPTSYAEKSVDERIAEVIAIIQYQINLLLIKLIIAFFIIFIPFIFLLLYYKFLKKSTREEKKCGFGLG